MINLDGVDDKVNIDGIFLNTFFLCLILWKVRLHFLNFLGFLVQVGIKLLNKVPALYGVKDAVQLQVFFFIRGTGSLF